MRPVTLDPSQETPQQKQERTTIAELEKSEPKKDSTFDSEQESLIKKQKEREEFDRLIDGK